MPEFTSYATGVPCWVDVTSPELDRTVSFYSDLFGWQADRSLDPAAGGYTMFTKDGKSVAAASPPPPGSEGMPPHWTTYLASDDVDATAARVTEAGGTLFMEPFDVFDAGRMVVAQDPTGSTFGVWQAGQHHGAQLANDPGTLNWNECRSPEPARAGEFYAAVFGYEVEEADMGGDDPYRVLKVDGRGVAGLMRAQDGEPPSWTTTFAVEDADASTKKVEELGGSVIMPPFDIPTVGRYAVVKDPVGAVFGILANA